MSGNIFNNFTGNGANINSSISQGGLRRDDVEKAGLREIEAAKDDKAKAAARQKLAADLSIFDALDSNKDRTLGAEELRATYNAADKNKDGNISSEELEKHFKSKDFTHFDSNHNEKSGVVYHVGKYDNNGNIKKIEIKNINKSDINSFMSSFLDDFNAQGTTSEHTSVDGRDAVVRTDENGNQVIKFNDRSLSADGNMRTISSEGDKTTTINTNSMGLKTDETIETSESITEIKYDITGKMYDTAVITDKNTGKVETIKYDNGVPKEKTVKLGSKEEIYVYNKENDTWAITRETVDLGNNLHKVTIHEYQDNNEIITIRDPRDNSTTTQRKIDGEIFGEVIQKPGENIVRQYRDGKVQVEEIITDNKYVMQTYDKNGNISAQEIREGNTHTVIMFGADGKENKKEITKFGKDGKTPIEQETTTRNEDGSWNKTIKTAKPEKTISTDYNASGHKTTETVIKGGKAYTAKFDGKGYGTLTIKAGESLEMFSKRTGVPVDVIKKCNKGLHSSAEFGKYAIAGDQIKVPEKYIKADSPNNYAVNAQREKAKGNKAWGDMVNRVNGEFSQTSSIKNSGKYDNYEQLAIQLLIDEGCENPKGKPGLVAAMAQKVKALNNGASIKNLSDIKIPVSQERLQEIREADPKYNAQRTVEAINQNLQAAIAAFETQLASDGWAEDIADKISVLWGSDNRANVVRSDITDLKNCIKAMRNYLDKGDMAGFKKAFKATYGVEYNEANVKKCLNNPNATDADWQKAFGNKRIANIQKRVSEYNQSQEAGGDLVKGVVVGATVVVTGVVTGGASIAVTTIACGAVGFGSTVYTEYSDAAFAGIKTAANGKGFSTGAQARIDNEGGHKGILTNAAANGVSSAVAAGTGGVVGNAFKGETLLSKTVSTVADNSVGTGLDIGFDAIINQGTSGMTMANFVGQNAGGEAAVTTARYGSRLVRAIF